MRLRVPTCCGRISVSCAIKTVYSNEENQQVVFVVSNYTRHRFPILHTKKQRIPQNKAPFHENILVYATKFQR